MTGADIAILILLTVSALVGLIRGFVKEIFSLGTWIAALLLSYLFRTPVGQMLPLDPDLNPLVVDLAGSICIFVLVLVCGGLITQVFNKLVQVTGLSGTDRTLGGVFGLARGLIIALAILIFLPAMMPVEEADWWTKSMLVPEFLAFQDWAMEVLGSLTSWMLGLFGGTE